MCKCVGACMYMFMSLCVGRIGAEGQAHILDGSSISQAGERPPFRVKYPTAVATFLEMEGCGIAPMRSMDNAHLGDP